MTASPSYVSALCVAWDSPATQSLAPCAGGCLFGRPCCSPVHSFRLHPPTHPMKNQAMILLVSSGEVPTINSVAVALHALPLRNLLFQLFHMAFAGRPCALNKSRARGCACTMSRCVAYYFSVPACFVLSLHHTHRVLRSGCSCTLRPLSSSTAAAQNCTAGAEVQSFLEFLCLRVMLCRSALDRLHDHAVHSDVCFVCGNSFAASPVNCNVHAFSAGEGGQGAGAFVMMNSSKKHDSVQARR